MEIPVILSRLQELMVAHFEENANGNFLGTLVYQDNTFSVFLFKDAVCQYICLEYCLNGIENTRTAVDSINERIIVGKCFIKDNDIILQSFFPIFEEKFIEQQVNHSISVLNTMIHICKH